MPIETREVLAGTITDAEQLRRELNVAAVALGTTCTTLAIYPGDPNDTIQMELGAAANAAAIDSVIAAHPSYTAGLASAVNLVAGTWVLLWTLPMAPGEVLTVTGSFDIRTGAADDVEAGAAEIKAKARRRTGGNAYVSGFSFEFEGDIPQARLRLQASGINLELRILTQSNAAATITGDVFARSELLS